MDEIINWLIGESVNITDIEFIARMFVLMLSLNLFAMITHELVSGGK